MDWSRSLFLGLWLLLQVHWSDAYNLLYCSSVNNGDGSNFLSSMYMSAGLCTDHCKPFAFAVVQGQSCWCSNYIPPDQVSIYSCSQTCPGYASEWCGNTDQGLFGYVLLTGATPSGTSGGGSSTASSSTIVAPSSSSVSTTPSSPGSSSSTPVPTVSSGSSTHTSSSSSSSSSSSTSSSFFSSTSIFSVVTISVTPQRSTEPTSSYVVPTTTISEVSSTTSTRSISSPSTVSSSSPSSTSTIPPSSSPLTTITSAVQNPTETQVFTSVTTVTGQVRTILVTPTPTPDSALGSGATASGGNGDGLSGGTVAGIVVGVALGLGLLIGLGVWFWLRRRHRRFLDGVSEGGSYVAASSGGPASNNGVPSRQVSQMSSAGLLTRNPRVFTQGLGGGDELRSAGTNNSNLDRRSLATDQRLNPYAIYSTEEHAQSNVSLQDNQDYSRQLRIANPDS